MNTLDSHAQFLPPRDRIVDLDRAVPLPDGSIQPGINLDNAARTPVLREVPETVNRFMNGYSSVHRGSGFKSRIATQAQEDARSIVARFVSANPDDHIVIFRKTNLHRQIDGPVFRSQTIFAALPFTSD